MKKFYIFLIPLFAMSLCFTSCSDDEEVLKPEASTLYEFDSIKVLSDYEFQFSTDLYDDDMFFDAFVCLDSNDICISDALDESVRCNLDKNDVFTYEIEGVRIFTLTKSGPSTFNLKMSETAHEYNNLGTKGRYMFEFLYETMELYGFFCFGVNYDGEKWVGA